MIYTPQCYNNCNQSWEFFESVQPELTAGLHDDSECLVRWNESVTNHCTFKTGGRIGALVFPFSETSLKRTLTLVRSLSLPLLMLGKGSNILIRDGGFPGIIVKLADNMSGIKHTDTKVSVLGGTTMRDLAHYSVDLGLSGLEWSSDIPGTIGGGIFMNAGMNEYTIGSQLVDVVVVNCDAMTSKKLLRHDCEFDYRSSRFQRSNEIIIQATFVLEKGDPYLLKLQMREIARERHRKFPLDYPNAGSIFKRPPGNYAGALIEQAGLKGRQRGGAMVSSKHAGFIINTGGASVRDIEELVEEIIEKVDRTFGVQLHPEIRIYGLP